MKDYWNDVFQPFLDSYRSGVETPNPDVMCNRLIKFNRFREHVTNRLGIRYLLDLDNRCYYIVFHFPITEVELNSVNVTEQWQQGTTLE